MTSNYSLAALKVIPWLVHPLLLLCIVLLLLYKYLTRNFNYWQKREVPFHKPIPLFGNFADVILLKTTPYEWLKKQYDSTTHPVLGIYILDDPYLVLRDPHLIHCILVENFKYFSDRQIAAPKHDKCVSNLLFFQKGPEWKERRSKLSPMFSTGKIKAVLPTFNECARDLVEYLNDRTGEVEASEVIARFSTDIVAKYFFGSDVGAFKGDPDFRKYGREIFKFDLRNAVVQSIFLFKPKWVDIFKLQFVKKHAQIFFRKVFLDAMYIRRQSSVKVGDLVDLLNEMVSKRECFGDEGIGHEKIVSPALQLYMAGYETTSVAVSFTLLELGVNMDIQLELRREIKNTIEKHNGLTFEAIREMEYLDMCIRESLRKYPPVGFVDRICNHDFKIPGMDLVIEKGICVMVPIFALSRDENYFPEPDKFIPERFSKEGGSNNKNVWLPFGKGPRYCIGDRFGIMMSKLALIHILDNFEVQLSENTVYPVVFDPKSWLTHSKGGLPLIFKKI
nr:cytochrome P450 [Phaedon brassicae]